MLLQRLEFLDCIQQEDKGQLSKSFGKAKNYLDASCHVYPLSAQLIAEYQRTDKVLLHHLKNDHHSKFFWKFIIRNMNTYPY